MFKSLFIIILFYTISFANELIEPIPVDVQYDEPKALLGKRLFFDPILSKDNSISCNSCHNLQKGGADSQTVSFGAHGKLGNIQAPTVFNARYNFKLFWNGRANNLNEQASGPINNPNEHDMNPKLIVKRLNNSQEYRKLFKEVFKTNIISYDNVIDSIVEFEKALVTPNAKFDRYLRGETLLTKDEKEGYVLFKQYGCITCHNGINIGGNSFQKIGTFSAYENNQSYPDRAKILNDTNYKNVFKVPTLRNIALTAPYFHDAKAKTLKDAVQKMSHYNLGLEISENDIEKIVSFLKTLTGEKPKILDK